MKPGKGVRRRSARMKALYAVRRVFVAQILATRRVCEVKWDDLCSGRSSTVHELIPRSQGGEILPGPKADAQGQRFFAACLWCHDGLHLNPAKARRRGLLRRRNHDVDEPGGNEKRDA